MATMDLPEFAPAQLLRLLEPEMAVEWTELDASGVVREQLGAPLLPDLLVVVGIDAARLKALVGARPVGETFLEHLLSPRPALEILEAIKAFAHHIENDVSNPMHGEPARVLYFGAIASAMARERTRITSLTDRQLGDGFEWMLGQECARELAALIEPARRQLGRSGGGK